MAGVWTDIEIEKMRDMIARGLPISLVAKNLGRSRNSVMGKKDRLKIQSPERPPKKGTKTREKDKQLTTKIGPTPAADCCHWPLPEGWCGLPALPGRPYCHVHNERSKLKPQPKLDIDRLLKIK